MGSAAIVIDNQADGATVSASSQELAMPAANVLSPHPSERWRSRSFADAIVLDKRSVSLADTVMIGGLTCGPDSIVRLRLATADNTGAAGDVFDSGNLSPGDRCFDVDYRSFVCRFSEPRSWRYLRFDIVDPDASYVEAGFIVDGLSQQFETNFAPGGAIQRVDRSRVIGTAAGQTLTWKDNSFRRADLNFEWVTATERDGLIERLDRVAGRHQNILLILDPDADSLPRAAIFGLVTDLTPVTFGAIPNIFGKQLRIEERL